MDHDQLFKEFVKEFVIEAMALFLPWLAQRLKKRPDWQNTEVFTNPPLGLVRRVDLLAELTLRGDEDDREMEELLDVEVESATSLSEVRKKIGQYFPVLRAQRNKLVTVLAFYLKVPLEGIGEDRYVEYEVRDPMLLKQANLTQQSEDAKQPEDAQQAEAPKVRYLVSWYYVGLPGLKVNEYLYGKNIFGVALCALMKIEGECRAEVKAEILRRIHEECREWNYRTVLLINVVESYLVLEGDELNAYQRLLQHEPKYMEIPEMMQTYADKLIAEGEREGERKGKRETLVRLAKRKCGEPNEATIQKIRQIEDLEQLERLIEASFTAESWEKLLAIE